MARRDDHVARIFAPRHARDREPAGEHAGHVLDRVDREVRAPFEQRLLDLLHEQTLSADLGERAVLDLVAGGDDLLFDELEIGAERLDARDERAALRQGEGASARGVNEARHARDATAASSRASVALRGGGPDASLQSLHDTHGYELPLLVVYRAPTHEPPAVV